MALHDSGRTTAQPDYPYGSLPLLPQWHDRWAQLLALLVVSVAGWSMYLHYLVWTVDRLALLIVLPALMGITLAFAPDPPSLVSRLAKRLVTGGCAIATLLGPWMAPMILALPAVLALSVGIGTLLERRHA